MQNIPKLFMTTGALLALVSMGWGIEMSVTRNHSLAPAHAHLNLIGFVIMSLFGIYYALTPDAAASGLARAHYWLTLVAVLVLIPGIVMAITERGEVLAKIGSVLAISTMALFVVVLMRNGVGKAAKAN